MTKLGVKQSSSFLGPSSFLVRCSIFQLFRLRCSMPVTRILCFARGSGASLGTARPVTAG